MSRNLYQCDLVTVSQSRSHTARSPDIRMENIKGGHVSFFLHYKKRTFYHVFQADKAHILNTSNMKDEEPTTLTYQGALSQTTMDEFFRCRNSAYSGLRLKVIETP